MNRGCVSDHVTLELLDEEQALREVLHESASASRGRVPLPRLLGMAREQAGAIETHNYGEDADVVEQLKELTAGRGPDPSLMPSGSNA